MPCVLVSPDSVARFFPAAAGLFDLVVFDEASQIRVADAVGALGRARAVVVVGDSKQMPPTSFAEPRVRRRRRRADLDETARRGRGEHPHRVRAGRVPRHWLSWHYRSQDESLIAFSNEHYYEDRLSSFPRRRSGVVGDPTGGISLVRVDGTFQRSGAGKLLRTNPVEAQAIVAEIRRRFAASPDVAPSIGVVTFNAQQRPASRRCSATPATSGWSRRSTHPARACSSRTWRTSRATSATSILFSTAFSVNDKGVLPLNFGPLNRVGGERRLNVAVTRARRQVVVFSSFDPAQLRAEETTSVGIKHLRAYLDMAAGGLGGRRRRPDRLGAGRRPAPRRDRRRAAGRAGSSCAPTSGCRTSGSTSPRVARTSPERPLVAVLLDGPGWARRRTVGDRDGLPVEVLSRMLGWPAVERVWLPAWLRDPDAVVAELVARVEAVRTGTRHRRPARRARREPADGQGRSGGK